MHGPAAEPRASRRRTARPPVVAQCRDGSVGIEHDPVLERLERVLCDQTREQRVACESLLESRRTDHLLRAVDRVLDAEASLASRALEGLVEAPARRIRRSKQLAQARRALARSEPLEAHETPSREIL